VTIYSYNNLVGSFSRASVVGQPQSTRVVGVNIVARSSLMGLSLARNGVRGNRSARSAVEPQFPQRDFWTVSLPTGPSFECYGARSVSTEPTYGP